MKNQIFPPAAYQIPVLTEKTQIDAVQKLIERRFPTVKNQIHLEFIAAEDGRNVFEVENIKENSICVRGSSGVAIARGLHWYMKHVCNQMISWCGCRIDITQETMKKVPGGIFRQILPHRNIVYMNYCTLSYSAPFWNWDRWEWEIDFMALNGINMPLSVTGLEAAWYLALTDPQIGYSDLEARSFLIGPAHMAWEWMQNIENEGDPLPMEWIVSHAELGRKIIERERSFGMRPIQQGFSGHVPRLFREKFPDAKISLRPEWCSWPGAAQLDPVDPLFSRFGKLLIEKEGQLFGFGGFYAADPFHESKPPEDISEDALPEYLQKVGENILRTMQSADPEAIWVMQSWDIREPIAKAVPKGKLLVLDLAGVKWEETESFWGHKFCTGQLHNFGGRINLHGDIADILKNNFIRANQKYPENAEGTGLFMEGITQNPVFYDAVTDVWWRSEGVETKEWMRHYIQSRYGCVTENLERAWNLLLDAPYRAGTNCTERSSIIAARPRVVCKRSGPNAGFLLYKPENYIAALNLLLQEKGKCSAFDGYRFDVADLTRQVLSNTAYTVHLEMAENFKEKNTEAFRRNAAKFRSLLLDADRICETRKEYRFSTWLNDATDWGDTPEIKAYLDKDATMLVTYWGPEKNPYIFDYSWREWSGLIREYYVKRWDMFHAEMIAKLERGESYDESGLPEVGGWRPNALYQKMADWEELFVSTPKHNLSRVTEHEDEIFTALDLQKKWKNFQN